MQDNINMANRPDPVVFFDGFCNFCSASVLFILKFEKKNSDLHFLSLQSPKVKSCYPEIEVTEPPESLVYYEDSRFYYRSDAALMIAGKLRSPWRFLYYLRYVPVFLRDWIYVFIAKNRYQLFGQKDSCFVPSEKLRTRFVDTQN